MEDRESPSSILYLRSSNITMSFFSNLLVLRRNEPPALERRLVVVCVLVRALGELHLLALRFLVWDQAQQVTDAVEARAPLVVRGNDVPGSPLCVRGLEHHVTRPRVLEPSAPRIQVRRAQFPLAHRIRDTGLEAPLLLRLAHLEPVLDQMDAVVDNVLLELGTDLEEAPVLRFRAETQHVLDACPVVPAPVENHDLTCRGRVLEVALHVELGLLAVGRRRQRHLAEYTVANTLGDRLDHATLAGGVASFKDHDYPRTLFLDPILQGAQLRLQLAERLFVLLTFQATIVSCHFFLPWLFRLPRGESVTIHIYGHDEVIHDLTLAQKTWK